MTGETRVTTCRRKEETDSTDCTFSGRVFQKMEAMTGNERRPAVDRWQGDVQLQRERRPQTATTWQATSFFVCSARYRNEMVQILWFQTVQHSVCQCHAWAPV